MCFSKKTLKENLLMKIFFFVLFLILSFNKLSGQVQSDPYTNRIQLNQVFAPFYHGVASGDALADRLIIWTRVTPDSTVFGSVQVNWKIATDTLFTNIVNEGTTFADLARDYTVKVDVTGLQPNTWYYYYFSALDKNSVVGRTKTTPVGNNDSIRFAVVTGSNYNSGYFNAYNAIALRNDIDAVLHLGDYIYEYETDGYGNNPDRELEPPTEVISSSDYRIRYSHYHLDPDLMYLHQQYPWYLIWDDHETANNSFKEGAENHDSLTEGSWHDRSSGAVEAYLEWLPIREQNPLEPLKIYREIHFGDLMDLIFLETRLIARDNQSMDINDTNKTMMGSFQFDWLTSKLDSSQASWKVIAQQVMMAPLATIGQITVNTDQWDGYPFERKKLLQFVINKNINNFLVLTGDIHTSWGSDLMYEQGTLFNPESYKSAGAEFITPSISSPSTNNFLGGLGSTMLTTLLPHIQYSNLDKRGYMIFNLTKLRAQADWYLMPDEDIAQYHVYNNSFDDSWFLRYNKSDRKIEHDGTPSIRTGHMPPLVSENPFGINASTENIYNGSSSLGVYPNPCVEQLTLVFYNYQQKNILFRIVDINGKSIAEIQGQEYLKGVHYLNINTGTLESGIYFIIGESNNRIEQKSKFIKQ